MREIADMGARAVDDLAIGLDQRIQFLLQRPDLLGQLAFELLGFARADLCQVLSHGAQRRESEAHLEECRHQEPEPEHGKGRDEHGGELGEIAVDLAGVASDRIGIGRGARACRLDLALDNAQALLLGTGGISAPRQACVGGDFILARQPELLIKQGIGDEIGTRGPVERLDLPVPAGEGNAEDGLAEIGGLFRRGGAALRGRGDEAGQIDIEARVEVPLDGLAVERNEEDGGDGKDDEGPRRGRGEQPEGEGVKPHRLRPRGSSRARGQS